MAQPGYNFSDLWKEAHNRWLKPAEVLFILQNYVEDQLTHELAKTPPTSGSLFLYNKRVLRFFRRDGHSWRKKKDGKTVGEAHERLKAGNIEALNCYYAHGEQNPNFQRRSYWMLDPAYDNIVLVHYRDITEGWQSSGSSSQFSSGTTLGQNSSSYQYPGSSGTISELYESNQSLSSPPSVEIASDAEMKSIRLERSLGIRRISPISSSSDLEVSEALHRLKEQLSLNDETLEEIEPRYYDAQDSVDVEHAWKDHSESSISVNGANDFLMLQNSVNNAQHHHHDFAPELTPDYKDSLCWKEMLDFNKCLVDVNSQDNNLLTSIENQEKELLPTRSLVEKEADQWINFEGSTSYINSDVTNCHNHTTLQYATTSSFDNNPTLPTSTFLSHDVQNFNLPAYNSIDTVVDYNEIFNQGQSGIHLEADQFSISHKQKFTIREVSPEWGYAYETTKVIIVGSFLCDPSKYVWTCMFGDIEVPVQIIQAGVICCLAPPLRSHGNVSLSITCGDQKSCSEVRAFEYRSKGSSFSNCNSSEEASSKSPEELVLLVRLVQMLLSQGNPLRDSGEPGSDLLRKLKVGQDSWDRVMDAVLDGSWTSSSTIDWLLQELLKDKLQQRLSPRSGGCEQFESSLSKKEQGMLHLVAGLDFEWALNPILNSGVNIDFRDITGWTALHWAAKFGRERMVAALLAKGASAGAVTDPSTEDPNGKTPATIASFNGHKGLAGYLSEIALTSHLSSLTLEEDDNSICSAEVEAEIRVNDISQRSITAVDQYSLAAVWNASQAASRIQAAFRDHSFRQRQQRGAASSSGIIDEYGIFSGDIEGLSAASKLAFGNARNHNTAALSIQKKYRGWKGRKNYLSLRRKVVKIQAHVRGHQVRAQYKVFCWAVGIMEKVVLRWRRRGCGLRGYKPELESIVENEAEEDILKVFRKKKVDGTVKDAFKRVLSMVEHPEARQQYCRMLAKHQEAKVNLIAESVLYQEGEFEGEFEVPESEINMTIVNDDDLYQYIM